jgi:hypothetical protein
MGRPPIGKVAMTGGERVQRYRLKHPVTKPVTKLGALEARIRELEAENARLEEALVQRLQPGKAMATTLGRAYRGQVPFGFERSAEGELLPVEAQQKAIREIAALRAQGRSLRAIRDELQVKGHKISHEGVARILKMNRAASQNGCA